jgi:hypothetical protein
MNHETKGCCVLSGCRCYELQVHVCCGVASGDGAALGGWQQPLPADLLAGVMAVTATQQQREPGESEDPELLSDLLITSRQVDEEAAHELLQGAVSRVAQQVSL